ASNGQLSRWLDGQDPLPAETLEAKELSEIVRETLAALPEEYADVLTAKYLDDVSVEQIAFEERSTETSIRSRFARPRQAFREMFVKDRRTQSTQRRHEEHKENQA